MLLCFFDGTPRAFWIACIFFFIIINNEQLFCIYGFINRRVRGVFELLSHLKPNRNSSGQCEYMGMSAGWSWKEQPQTNPHQRNRRRYTEWQSHPAASPGSHAPHWSNDGLIKKGSGGGGGDDRCVLLDRVSRLCSKTPTVSLLLNR